MTKNATLGYLTSLEEFVIVVMNKKLISPGVTEVLWQIFGKFPFYSSSYHFFSCINFMIEQKNEEDPLEGRGALMILCMMANVNANIVKSKLQRIFSCCDSSPLSFNLFR